MGNCCDGRTSVEKQIDDFLKMLGRMPEMKRYPHNKTNVLNFTRAWNSRQFGGSVLGPLGAPLKKRTKKNSLKDDIKAAQLNVIYGGGYYVLQDVQQFEDNLEWFYDIFILVEKCEDVDNMKKIKKLHEKYQASLKLKAKDRLLGSGKTPDYILFDDIKDSVTGWCRIVSYKNNGDGTPNSSFYELDSMHEGQYKKGKKSGYARGISAIDGSCAVGFHQEGKPNGKWTAYKPNGDFAKPEGFYEGSKCTKQMEIRDYCAKIVKDRPDEDTPAATVKKAPGIKKSKPPTAGGYEMPGFTQPQMPELPGYSAPQMPGMKAPQMPGFQQEMPGFSQPMQGMPGMANPMGGMANPMGGMANPMGAMANPMSNPMGAMAMANGNPMGSMANPMGSMANPMGSMANPMGSMANPMGSMANPMGGMANPMGGMSNPMGALGKKKRNLGGQFGY